MLHYGGDDKCGFLAQHFRSKFEAPWAVRQSGEHIKYVASAGRWRNTGVVERITEIEIRKAVGELASGRAPGPDGLPADVFRNLPALTGMLASLLTTVFTSGRMPYELVRVFLSH